MNDWRGWVTTLKRFQRENKNFLGYKQLNTFNHPYHIHIQINRQETFHQSVSFQYILSGENYQESESSVEYPLPMICTRKIYF